MKDYYKILEVNPSASQDVIAKVYKILVKKYHPDLQEPNNIKQAEEKMKEISEAYEKLSDEQKRKEYDEELSVNETVGSVDMKTFIDLQEHCVQLEKEVNSLRSNIYNKNKKIN